ncbi:LPXTG cell wall anchor domain-containing protein [Flavobacterium cupreum]|uniref:LPXTG cell wall anchor domain-containing protein n=2 Tax=Flavobacterium TaxID=237 RepID=A0A434A043_9FLAO|nr:LPXTG cell wall anchor domain-containing protein [Flavobacterium cupreum]RUT67731.1 LPXTG cell wall anchor domain-containing protein [Flavobacterium cupreum]
MKLKNEDKLLIGGGLLAVGTIGFLYWKKKKKEKENDLLLDDIPEPPTVVSNPVPTAGATLDRNKVLSKGSKGLEVRELQRLLGVKIDGDFGSNTLTALQKKKGVAKISLAGYIIAKPVAGNATKAIPTALVTPKAGQKLMANMDKVSLFNAKRTASGVYFNDGSKPFFGSSINYGQYIGTFVAEKLGGQYLIKRDDVYYFVNANAVKAY